METLGAQADHRPFGGSGVHSSFGRRPGESALSGPLYFAAGGASTWSTGRGTTGTSWSIGKSIVTSAAPPSAPDKPRGSSMVLRSTAAALGKARLRRKSPSLPCEDAPQTRYCWGGTPSQRSSGRKRPIAVAIRVDAWKRPSNHAGRERKAIRALDSHRGDLPTLRLQPYFTATASAIAAWSAVGGSVGFGTEAKSPRIAFKAIRSSSISRAVRTPRRRNTGNGGHHPCTACWNRKPATTAGKTNQRRCTSVPSVSPRSDAAAALASSVRSMSHSRSSARSRASIAIGPPRAAVAIRSRVERRMLRLTASAVRRGTRWTVGGTASVTMPIVPAIDMPSWELTRTRWLPQASNELTALRTPPVGATDSGRAVVVALDDHGVTAGTPRVRKLCHAVGAVADINVS